LLRDVKNSFASLAGAATAQAGNDLRDWELVIHNRGEGNFLLLEELVQGLRLRECPGKSVEKEAAETSQTASTFADHLPHGRVRNKCAAAHEVEGGGHGRGRGAILPRRSGAKNITGGQVTCA
jgi:hypothetical protein